MKVSRTQQEYAGHLATARDKYAVPLRKTNSTVSGATREDIQELFGTLEVLASFEEEIAKTLHIRLVSRFAHPTVGDVFLRLSSIFPLYVEYCREMSGTFVVLGRLQKTPLFGSYIHKLFEASGNRLPLTTIMEQPPQHLFHLETILAALVQLTPTAHADSSRLRSAHKACSDACGEVKAFEEENKAQQKLAAMTRRIVGLPESVIAPGRKLLFEMDVTLVNDAGASKKRVLHRAFLFGDCVVIALVQSSKSLKFVEQVPLVGLRYNSLHDTESVYNGFELQNMTRRWLFVCDTFEAKMQLESAFTDALSLANSSSSFTSLLDGGAKPSQQSQKKQPRSSLDSSRASSSFTLQRLRLESEIQTVSENVARLPKEARDSLFARRYEGLLEAVEHNAGTALGALDADGLIVAAKALDGRGKLAHVLKKMQGELVQLGPSRAALFALLRSRESPAVSLATAAATFAGARPWIAALLGKHMGSIRQRKTGAEEVAKAVLADVAGSLRDVPLLVQVAVASFRHVAQKKMRQTAGDADASAFAFFGAAFLVGGLRWAPKMGLCERQEEVTENYVEALRNAVEVEANNETGALKKALLEACSGKTELPSTISAQRLEEEAFPGLVQGLMGCIENMASTPELIKALAVCFVLQK